MGNSVGGPSAVFTQAVQAKAGSPDQTNPLTAQEINELLVEFQSIGEFGAQGQALAWLGQMAADAGKAGSPFRAGDLNLLIQTIEGQQAESAAALAVAIEGAVTSNPDTQTATLGDLVDTAELAAIAWAQRDTIDAAQFPFLAGGLGAFESEASLAQALAGITVHHNVDLAQVTQAVKAGMGVEIHLGDMMSAGAIIVAADLSGKGPDDIGKSTADLLAHEAVHWLQMQAAGSRGKFLAAYFAEITTKGYDPYVDDGSGGQVANNLFEREAYDVGGRSYSHLKGKGDWQERP